MTEVEKVSENGSIEWGLFESKYIKLEEAEPSDLTLTDWRQTEEEYQGEVSDGIRCEVISENGQEVKKILKSTSKRLITALKPHIIAAEKSGEKKIRVRITKTGSKFNTQYNVKPLN
ncbi:hypothetical protein HOA91_02725 [Candidatus Woesearchaeota archaeon]|jgi:hypothetical protein|nr:hypothetical protein [Candidatus Woesearchaeota archaeon]